jgi:hypothetical protein
MSELVDQLLAGEHLILPGQIDRLSDQDLRTLEAAAMGVVETADRPRAIALLTAFQGARAIPVLTELLADTSQATSTRTIAAAQLGNTSRSAEPALTAAVSSEGDLTVQIASVGALGKVGTEVALEPLERLSRDADEPVAGLARAAATVVAFRHRLAGYEPSADDSERLELPQERTIGLRVREATERDTSSAFAELHTESYGLAFGTELSRVVVCAGETLLVALDAGLRTDDLNAYMGAGPLIAGLIAVQTRIDGSFSTRWLLLCWETSDGYRLGAYRPSGLPFLQGRVDVAGAQASFGLTSVRGRGNQPVELSGNLAPDGFVLEGVSAADRPERGAPTPLE